MPKKSFKWTHDGIEYTITKSNKPEKKLQAVYTNPETKRENVIYFGATGYEVYKDATGLLDKKWIHNDEKRRDNFRSRFRSKYTGKPNSLTLSWNLLW